MSMFPVWVELVFFWFVGLPVLLAVALVLRDRYERGRAPVPVDELAARRACRPLSSAVTPHPEVVRLMRTGVSADEAVARVWEGSE